MKSLLKIYLITMLAILLISPILHQDINTSNVNNLNYKCYFSILDSVQADIDDKDFQTGYFVKNVFSK